MKKKIILTDKEKKVIKKDFTKGEPDFKTWSKEDKKTWGNAVIKSLLTN